MQIIQILLTLGILGVLFFIIQHLGEIRAALVKADPRLGGKVMCYYCNNYFLITDVEIFGAYTYCVQHGRARQRAANLEKRRG